MIKWAVYDREGVLAVTTESILFADWLATQLGGRFEIAQ